MCILGIVKSIFGSHMVLNNGMPYPPAWVWVLLNCNFVCLPFLKKCNSSEIEVWSLGLRADLGF